MLGCFHRLGRNPAHLLVADQRVKVVLKTLYQSLPVNINDNRIPARFYPGKSGRK
jgi:hypothetical protein